MSNCIFLDTPPISNPRNLLSLVLGFLITQFTNQHLNKMKLFCLYDGYINFFEVTKFSLIGFSCTNKGNNLKSVTYFFVFNLDRYKTSLVFLDYYKLQTKKNKVEIYAFNQ